MLFFFLLINSIIFKNTIYFLLICYLQNRKCFIIAKKDKGVLRANSKVPT